MVTLAGTDFRWFFYHMIASHREFICPFHVAKIVLDTAGQFGRDLVPPGKNEVRSPDVVDVTSLTLIGRGRRRRRPGWPNSILSGNATDWQQRRRYNVDLLKVKVVPHLESSPLELSQLKGWTKHSSISGSNLVGSASTCMPSQPIPMPGRSVGRSVGVINSFSEAKW